MARHRVVLRGGTVLTMDPQLGNLSRGDVLIEDGVIAAVGPELSADEAETANVTGHIVAPGMIDTHPQPGRRSCAPCAPTGPWRTTCSASGSASHRPTSPKTSSLGPFADVADAERIVLNLHRAYADVTGHPFDLTQAFADTITFNSGPLHTQV